MRELRPLRWFLILWVGLVYLWGTLQLLRAPERELLFSALIVAHAALYWISLSLIHHHLRLLLYCVAQAAIVVTISIVTYNPLVILGLYEALIGATVLLLGQARPCAVAVVGYLALAILNLRPLAPAYNDFAVVLTFVVPVTLFVVGGAAMFLRQSNDRARIQALLSELEAAHRQLADYAARVGDLTLTAERQRLARELHDSVTQSLYSVTLYAEAAARLLADGQMAEAAGHLHELRDTAQEALREMRLLIFELRPLALEKSGLAAALQARLEAVEGRGGLQVEFQAEGTERLSSAVQQELYHIAQEALNNVLKHAKAQRVQVHLQFQDTTTHLEICDDGMGFAIGQVQESGGLGLPGMRERAQKIGGKLLIESTSGKGTKVAVEISTSPQLITPRIGGLPENAAKWATD